MQVFIVLTFVLIVFLAIIGKPLFAVIALTALANWFFFALSDNKPILDMLMIVPQEISGIAKMPLIYSIPLFTFAGYVLASSNASKRLVRLTKVGLGWMPGGLAIVTLVTCAFFTAFTGASGVTIVALGGFLLPALMSEGYKEKFSLGLVTSSGGLGLLFPPSLPLILFGVVSQKPILDSLFIGGAVPGILRIVILSIFAMIISKKFHIPSSSFNFKELREALWDIKWELPLPILLFTGIYLGKLTVSDAAAFTAVYILVVEVLFTKDVKVKQLPKIIQDSMVLVGAIIVILSVSLAATNYVIYQQVPDKIFAAIKGIITNKWTFLIALNIFLLVVGCIMDIFSAIVVVVPLILPIAYEYNINLIHLGIIFITNLEIGYLTPPVGMNLFISSIRFNKPIVTIYKSVISFILIGLFSLGLFTYLPQLSIWFIEQPALESRWEFDTKNNSGHIDRIDIHSGGVYYRLIGSNMDLLTKEPIKGRYTISKNTIRLEDQNGYESYKFEIYNDGERLLLELLEESRSKELDINTEVSSNDEFSFDDGGFGFDDSTKSLSDDNKKFYINKINPTVKKSKGGFIGFWRSNSGEKYEFNFQNELKVYSEKGISSSRVNLLKKKTVELTFPSIPIFIDDQLYDEILNSQFTSENTKAVLTDYYKISSVPSVIPYSVYSILPDSIKSIKKYYTTDIQKSWILKKNILLSENDKVFIKEVLNRSGYKQQSYCLESTPDYNDLITISSFASDVSHIVPLVYKKDVQVIFDSSFTTDELRLVNKDNTLVLIRE